MNKEYKKLEWTDENVKRFWDYESQFIDNYFSYQVGKNVIGDLFKYFEDAKTALDYGSGPGFLIPYILEKGIEVTALDFSEDSLKKVNDKYGDESLFKGALGLEEIKKTGNKFDLIIAVEVIEHLDDDYLEKTMRNISELLSENGIAIMTTPNDEELSKSMVYCPQCDHVFHRWQHERSWSQESLLKYIKEKNMEVVDIFATNFSHPPRAEELGMIGKIRKIFKIGSDTQAVDTNQPHLVCIIRNKK